MIEYEQRDAVLRAMGFPSYQTYLDSRLWSRIRQRVLKRRRNCACCGESAKEVHHRDYTADTISGKRLDGLVPLCSTCHDLAEFDGCGNKATLAKANETVDMLSSLEGRATPTNKPLWQVHMEAKRSLKEDDAKRRKKTKKIVNVKTPKEDKYRHAKGRNLVMSMPPAKGNGRS